MVYNSPEYIKCAVCETKIHESCIDHVDDKRYDLCGHDELNNKPICDNCICDTGIFYTVGIK